MATRTTVQTATTRLAKSILDGTKRTTMRWETNLRRALIAAGLVASIGLASQAEAVFLTTTQPTSPSNREVVWGQGVTLNIGADLPDASIPPTVNLDFVGMRSGDPTAGSPDDRTAVYLHVYSGFGINPDGTIDGSAIGSLAGISTNTVDLEAATDNTDVFWFFSGPSLAKNITYHYIMANSAAAATPGGFSNLIYNDMVVALGDPHAGGQAYVQTGDLPLADMYFRIGSSFTESGVPEPSTYAMAALGLGLLAFRQRRIV